MRNEENECFCEVCHADASVWVCGTHVFIAKPSFMRNYHCYCSALSSFVLIFASRSWLNSSINASLYGRVVNGGSAPSLVNQFEQAAIGSAKKNKQKEEYKKIRNPHMCSDKLSVSGQEKAAYSARQNIAYSTKAINIWLEKSESNITILIDIFR